MTPLHEWSRPSAGLAPVARDDSIRAAARALRGTGARVAALPGS